MLRYAQYVSFHYRGYFKASIHHQRTHELQHCIAQTKVHSLKNYRGKKDRTDVRLHMLHARNYKYDARGRILRINKLGLYTVNLYKREYVRVFGAWE
jgi:hypothetical protein